MNKTAKPAVFRNEPFTDFSQEPGKRAMQEAIAKVKSELGREYPLRIGGELIFTEDKICSFNPGQTGETIGW